MYDETMRVLNARREVIDHDQPILNCLMEDTLSVKESWELIQSIESELIRFHAAQDFLHEILGEGTVDVSNSGRIRLMQDDTMISFPGAETCERYIYVRFDSLTSPLTQLKRPNPTPPSEEERQKEAYAKLLRANAPLSERVKIRCEKFEEWGVFSYLFYLFILLPKDFFSEQNTPDYWESAAREDEKIRRETDNTERLQWIRRKDRFKTFYYGIYNILEQFGFPVYLGNPGSAIIVEQASKLIES